MHHARKATLLSAGIASALLSAALIPSALAVKSPDQAPQTLSVPSASSTSHAGTTTRPPMAVPISQEDRR